MIWKLIYHLENSTVNRFRKIQRWNYSLDDLLFNYLSSIKWGIDSLIYVLMRLTGIVWGWQNLYFDIFICLWSLKLWSPTCFRSEFSSYFLCFFLMRSFMHRNDTAWLIFLLFRFSLKLIGHVRKYLGWRWCILVANRLNGWVKVCHQRTWSVWLYLRDRIRDLLTNLFQHHYIVLFAQRVNLDLWISSWRY